MPKCRLSMAPGRLRQLVDELGQRQEAGGGLEDCSAFQIDGDRSEIGAGLQGATAGDSNDPARPSRLGIVLKNRNLAANFFWKPSQLWRSHSGDDIVVGPQSHCGGHEDRNRKFAMSMASHGRPSRPGPVHTD